MAYYQNRKQNNYGYGWENTEYQVYETAEYHPWHHHEKKKKKVVVVFEEPISRAESYTERRFGDENKVCYENVNQEADAFIQHEHKRMELARLMSSMNDD